MTQEELKQETQLIFARACAESLKESVGYILRDDLKEEKARAHGEAFASAFVFMSRYFTGTPATPLEKEAEEARIQRANQAIADYWKDGGFRRSQPDQQEGRGYPVGKNHPEGNPEHGQAGASQQAPYAKAAGVHLPESSLPDQEASDASQ